jgi:hypothetical protein
MVPSKDVRGTGQPEGSNPPDKPLPSLPIATIQGGSPIVRRSLIDASEKPLRRSISSSSGENVEEEWPTLSPSRTTTPNSNQKVGHETASDLTGGLTGDKSGAFSTPAKVDHQRFDTCQHEGEEATTEIPGPRQGSRGVAVLATISSANNQSRLASAPKVNGLQSRKRPFTDLLDAKESLSTGTDRDILNEGASSDIGPAKVSTSGAFTPSNIDFSSTVQATPFSQGSARARVSRLPKRLSVPGPVRNSGSPRRTLSGRSTPYDSLAARISCDPSLKQGQGPNGAKKPAERTRPYRVGHAVYGDSPASGNVPSLVTVKQSSKHGQVEDGKSSIPRPRHQFHLYQDVDSEAEIFVSKMSRKKLFSNRAPNDRNSDDADLDTDEDYKVKEGNVIARDFNPPKADKQAGQVLNNGAEMELHVEAARAGVAEETVSPAVEKALTASSENCQVDKSSAADSGSVLDTSLNTSRQGLLVEKPLDRVKRLSATAPEHGPVLRISDSADKIIMGYGSDDDVVDSDMPARKRNSVPDLRRSVVVKELRKSTEGLLNSHMPLSRSSTTGSFSKTEVIDQAGEAWDVRRNSDSHSGLLNVAVRGTAPNSEDPFSTTDGMGTFQKHKIARKPTPHGRLDWPLKSSPQTSAELHPVREDSCEESASWVTPFQSPLTTNVCEHKSFSKSEAQESPSVATASFASASKRPNLQMIQTSGGKTHSLASGNKLLGNANRGHSAAQAQVQFPPRISSRTNTPEVSLRPRQQFHLSSSREIPNRFDTAHPRRLSEDFSVPKNMTVEADTLRNSVHNLKGTEKPSVSTPAARETSKVQLSTAKGMLSNIKGLFHKRSIETPTPSSTAKSKAPPTSERCATVAVNSSPCPNYHSRTLPVGYGAHKSARTGISIVPTPRDAFPKSTSTSKKPPSPSSPGLADSDDYRQATDLAMRILDAAQTEHDAPKRARLVQVCFSPTNQVSRKNKILIMLTAGC